jgi:hypothetical protein
MSRVLGCKEEWNRRSLAFFASSKTPRGVSYRCSRSCPRPWCRSGYPERSWLLGQAATVGRVTMGASLSGAMVSRLM